ncbi:MAG: hypothetical protein GX638_13695 [Crenarchaeota archaeon]|nr:hypothetical protein [Thermoproteota archaeon]
MSDKFESELYSAILLNLKDNNNPLRLNNFAYAMRELTRHVLKRLAPDEKVILCPWYKNETAKKNGVTRKQRAYFSVQGGLCDTFVKKELEIDVENVHHALLISIDNLSKYTHIEKNTFAIPSGEIQPLVEKIFDSVNAFFETIRLCKKTITDKLWEILDSAVIEETLSETILAIDTLATHHTIEEVYVDKIFIPTIDHEYIYFDARGTIGCELQWGSNSDLRSGDGAVMPESFPFSCELKSSIICPQDVEVIEGSLNVDTSTWDDMHDDIEVEY